MLAVYAHAVNPSDPLDALTVGQIELPDTPAEWVTVNVKAVSINHHDVWALRGQALRAEQVPMILGTDAAGVTNDGREVIVYAVVGDPAAGFGDETADPGRTMLSEKYPGTLAEQVRVPARNLVDKPALMSWEEAACLPTAYLTAYRMLTTRGQVQPGETVLVQGAAGGVATACIVLARAMGANVWVTSRDADKRDWALSIGADQVFESGQRLPSKVDAVMESVGAATWEHSIRSLRPGGRIVIAGATTGGMPPAQLNHIFFLQLSILGSTMGTLTEFENLISFMEETGTRPVIDRVLPMAEAREALQAMESGNVKGKIVLVP